MIERDRGEKEGKVETRMQEKFERIKTTFTLSFQMAQED